MQQSGPVVSRHGLDIHGIDGVAGAYWNYATSALYEEALQRREGRLAQGGALVVETGEHTGRSAGDKFIVEDPSSSADIDWGKVNKSISAEHFDGLKRGLLNQRSTPVCSWRIPPTPVRPCFWALFTRSQLLIRQLI